jgi:hypothetical protein
LGDFFFTACFGEVDAALFHAVDDRADEVRQSEGLGHVGVDLSRYLAEIVQVRVREDQSLQLAAGPFVADR